MKYFMVYFEVLGRKCKTAAYAHSETDARKKVAEKVMQSVAFYETKEIESDEADDKIDLLKKIFAL